MSTKLSSPDHPVFTYGKVVFDFFHNDDEEQKTKLLHSLCKDIRKKLNVSCLQIREHIVENPERGTIIWSFCSKNKMAAGDMRNQLMEFIDQQAPARILDEQVEQVEIT